MASSSETLKPTMYVFTKVEETFTQSLGFRVCARALEPPGWVTTTFGTPGLASLVMGLASARLAETAMVSSGMKSVFAFHL